MTPSTPTTAMPNATVPGPAGPAGPAFMLPVLALSLMALASAAVLAPVVDAAYGAEAEALATIARRGLWATVAATPVVALLKGAVLGALAWAVLVLGGKEVPYRDCAWNLLVAELILGAQALWTALLLRLRGIDASAGPEALRISTGLDLLFPDPTTPVGGLALSVTPFHAAWFLFLAWAFSRVGGSRPMGLLASLACWLPGAALPILRAWAP